MMPPPPPPPSSRSPGLLDAPLCIPAHPANAAWTAAAATTATVNIVLPTSPDTTRFAMNGISRIMIDSRILLNDMSSIWLAPRKAPPKLCAVKMLFRLFALMIVNNWLMMA
jgi:hypothetical protein